MPNGTFLVAGASNSLDGDMPAAVSSLRNVGIYAVLTSDRSQASFGRVVDRASVGFVGAAVTSTGVAALLLKSAGHGDNNQVVPFGELILINMAYPDSQPLEVADDGLFFGASAMADGKLAVVGYTSPDSLNYPGAKGMRDALLVVFQTR